MAAPVLLGPAPWERVHSGLRGTCREVLGYQGTERYREFQGRDTERSSWQEEEAAAAAAVVVAASVESGCRDSASVGSLCDWGCIHLSRELVGCWVISHTSSYSASPSRISLSFFRQRERGCGHHPLLALGELALALTGH